MEKTRLQVNLEILNKIKEALLRSPDANFQKLLYLSGVSELFEIIDEDDCLVYLSAADVNEKSEDTLQRIVSNLN